MQLANLGVPGHTFPRSSPYPCSPISGFAGMVKADGHCGRGGSSRHDLVSESPISHNQPLGDVLKWLRSDGIGVLLPYPLGAGIKTPHIEINNIAKP